MTSTSSTNIANTTNNNTISNSDIISTNAISSNSAVLAVTSKLQSEDLEALVEEEQKMKNKCLWPTMDDWKRLYMNLETRTQALQEAIDPKKGFFIWKAVFLTPEDLNLMADYMIRNRVNGLFQNTNSNKFAFAQSQIIYPIEEEEEVKSSMISVTHPAALNIYWIFNTPEDASVLLGDEEIYSSFHFTRVNLDSVEEVKSAVDFFETNTRAKHPMLR